MGCDSLFQSHAGTSSAADTKQSRRKKNSVIMMVLRWLAGASEMAAMLIMLAIVVAFDQCHRRVLADTGSIFRCSKERTTECCIARETWSSLSTLNDLDSRTSG